MQLGNAWVNEYSTVLYGWVAGRVRRVTGKLPGSRELRVVRRRHNAVTEGS